MLTSHWLEAEVEIWKFPKFWEFWDSHKFCKFPSIDETAASKKPVEVQIFRTSTRAR